MSPLEHIVEPVGLLLTWLPLDEQAPCRTRRVVAEIRKNTLGIPVFRYLKDTQDFQMATEAGFQGYPAFDQKAESIETGVLDAFLRRLPPRKREDFAEFLTLHRLPVSVEYSDFALLAYTGARLPSDGFSIVPIFPDDACPCDYLLEIAGFRHAPGAMVNNLQIDDEVHFCFDEGNPVDADAIAIIHDGVRIGYVNRALKGIFGEWLQTKHVTATVERINGKPNRPLVYVRVAVR